MQNQSDHIERKIHRRDVLLAESVEDGRSFSLSVFLNWLLGLIRLCALIYCLFVVCSHIYILVKTTLNPIQIYNIIFEILMCDFVIHDALAAGGWMPGVSNSLFLIRFAKLIPYYSQHQEYQYHTSIPKNYLRAALLLFVASINNCNDTFVLLQDIRILNIALMVFGLLFIFIGYIGIMKAKLRPFYVDWILESNKNMETKQSISYETNTWCGWVSMVFHILFLFYIVAVYLTIIITTIDSLPLFVVISCIAKCLLCVFLIGYLMVHRRVLIEVNWYSVFILLFALNAAINVQYDFEAEPSLNKYCLYIWCLLLLIEFIRFVLFIVMYFLSMYRYYTPFKFFLREIAEWSHFWVIKQGLTKMGLILIILALPFLFVVIKTDWFVVDMYYTPFFDYESPLNLKKFNIDQYWDIFEDIYAEVEELLEYFETWTEISSTVMCGLIIAAFAAIIGASIIPGGSSGAAAAYNLQRVYKIAKRVGDMFKKIYTTVKSLVDKIKTIIAKVKTMLSKVRKFVTLLNKIRPKNIGLTSVAGLFGLIVIPATTVVIILYMTFFDRSLRFNSFHISAHMRHWSWLLFMFYLLLLNIANFLVILSLHQLLTDIFVFETVVFASQVLYADGYHAMFIVHILIIVGISLFIIDRLFLRYCAKTSCYTWSKTPNDLGLHSFCKCKAETPCMQSMIAYVVEFYQWHDTETMTYDQMCACIMHMDEIEKENEKVIENILNTCWCCIKYNHFNKEDHTLTKKEWEYFLTSYKLGNFPWTQPASARNMALQNQLKQVVDELYASDDHIEYQKFREYQAQDIAVLNVEGCKQFIAHLRSLLHQDMEIDLQLLSDNDLGVKLFLNLSKAQLNHLLTRFDETSWGLITATDVIHDTDTGTTNDENAYHVQGASKEENLQTQTESEIELNEMKNINLPPGWRRLVNEEGLIYYHNDELNKTQWDVPTEVEDDEEPKQTEVEEDLEEEEDETDDGALPTGWDKFINEEGIEYYHNAALRQTQWKRPRAATLEDVEKETEELGMPAFWRKVTHNAENVYYHNEKTGKTQWEQPKIDKPQVFTFEEKKDPEPVRYNNNQSAKPKPNNGREIATQTTFNINGVFERKIIYHRFFAIAMDDILMKNNIKDRSETETDTDVCIEERELMFIDLIDKRWIQLNEIILFKLNRDNGEDKYAPTKFAAETILSLLHELNDEGYAELLDIADQNAIFGSEKWFKYLERALIEYNNYNTKNDLILIFPIRQRFETWCVYMILLLLVSVFTVYTMITQEFMSMEFQPTLELVNTVSALVKAKESVISEWEELNFDSHFDFQETSDDQFYECDIGSIFVLLPTNPLSKYNSFPTFLSSMIDGFTMDDISLIELLDEIDVYQKIGIDGIIDGNIDFNDLDLASLVEQNLQIDSLDLDALDFDRLDLEGLGIDNIGDLANVDWANLDIENIDLDTLQSLGIIGDFNFVQFPMIDLMTWPSKTISLYPQWFFIIVFGPIFAFCMVFGLMCVQWYLSLKKKSFEIDKQLIATFVILGGFCGLQIVLCLGSILSVVAKFLPHSWVTITYGHGYYNLILTNIFVMLIGLMIFIDVFAGEHVPTLSTIYSKKKQQQSHTTANNDSGSVNYWD